MQAKCMIDATGNAVEVGEHVGRSNAQDAITLGCQPEIAALVMRVRLLMGLAINFDNEFFTTSSEISNIDANRHLTAEFPAVQATRTQHVPKPGLWRRHLMPHRLGTPTLRLHHLPPPGGGRETARSAGPGGGVSAGCGDAGQPLSRAAFGVSRPLPKGRGERLSSHAHVSPQTNFSNR